MTHGFDAERNTFTQSYGRPELDASLLLIPRVGFLPPDDPRVIGTIDAIQRELTEDGFVLRYRPADSDDGLPGDEGVFLACSFWLVEALLGRGPPPAGHRAVRTAAGAAQRRGPAERGVGGPERPASGKHTPGLQPLRARDERPGTASAPDQAKRQAAAGRNW